MKWSREKPSVRGIYWVMWGVLRGFMPQKYVIEGPQLVLWDDGEWVDTFGNDCPTPITDVAWWYGPLDICEPDAPPKEQS